MLEWKITEQEEGRRLDRYLMKVFPKAPSGLLFKSIRTKAIKVNGRRTEPAAKLKAGDLIQIYFTQERSAQLGYGERPPESAVPGKMPFVPVVYEDDFVIILNKPAGVLSQKDTADGYSLSEYLVDYLRQKGEYRPSDSKGFRPGLCNRLDRNTTGIAVAGKTLSAAQALTQAIRSRQTEKTYLAVCLGVCPWKGVRWLCHEWSKDGRTNQVSLKKGKIFSSEPMQQIGKDQVLCSAEALGTDLRHGWTLFRIRLITGKSHQLRAQLSSEGYPILGDHKYGGTAQINKNPLPIRNQLLHAFTFCMQDAPEPLQKLSGRTFCAPLPDEFRKILKLGFSAWLQILDDQGEKNV